MDGERKPAQENEGVNDIGPAGQNADPTAGEPVSGMPAGGPHDLGAKAAQKKQDATGQA